MSLSGMKANSRLVLLDQTFASAEEAIDTLAGLAKKEDLITDLFIEKVKQREKEYPTGLAMSIGIAIPHIEEGCRQSFVSIATLKKPVVFKSMDGSDDDVPVEIVFLFGITNPQEQVEILKQFALAFSREESLRQLLNASVSSELLASLNTLLHGCLNVNEPEK